MPHSSEVGVAPALPGEPLMGPVYPWLEQFLDAHRDELIAFRRRLHAHPEVSWAELETTAAVISEKRNRRRKKRVTPTRM